MDNHQNMLREAIASLQAGDLPKAESLFRHVLENRPHNPVALMYLGVLASRTGHPDDAERLLRRSIAINPDNPDAYHNLAVALEHDGKVDEAITAYLQVLELKPDDTTVMNNLGNCYKYIGETEAALAQYRKVVTLEPGNAEVFRNIAITRSFTESDQDVRDMERLLARTDLAKTQQYYLHYALGKVYEDIGDYARSFDHYQQANALKRSTFTYDIDGFERQIAFLVQTITRDVMVQIPGSAVDDDTPVFIVGMPRSGTSLVEQILGCHPQVCAAGELRLLGDCVSKYPLVIQYGYPLVLTQLKTGDVHNLARCYIDGIRRIDSRALRITDKMPQNFLLLGLIPKLFPRAKIIHCHRNPVDTCMSCYALLFSQGHEYSYDLQELGRYYRTYQKLMAHWQSLMGDSILEVEYESLVADPEAQIRDVLTFCGLDWDAACLRFHESSRAVRTASAAQVRRPINDRSVGRGERYRQFLGPLLDQLDR